MINVFQPALGEEELRAVAEVFADNWPGHGPRTQKFEAEFAHHIGADPDHVLFLNSCTSGLFLAVQMLGLGPGDEVVLPSAAFVAAANAVAASGARPVFCDVDPRTSNATAAHVEQALTPRTKAVLVLHYGGSPGDVEAVARLCRSRGLPLIEDAACAVASRVGDTACGMFGDIAVWSFDSAKVLVTGDGGMLHARSPELARKARTLAYHGLRHDSGFAAARVSPRWWELELETFGRRVVGNDLTAAIGSVQLAKLPANVARRTRIARRYDELLAGAEEIQLPPALPAGHVSSHYFYWVQMPPEIRDGVAADLLDQGIYTTFRYPPLHRLPAYGATGTELPGTDQVNERTLLLPLHQGLDDSDVRTVAEALREAAARRAA
ncbi:DegT/DnrJ/EryC1/StrS family aminotransferase (plasmid) [Streptomyces sp. WA1-19]|uniref:DegT/DnrJ/EryC1/StrS family aminotransferase n=1 Tax=Streptomyces TaxID=1883 RepID=UPI001A4E3AFD|nr:DegT/DnrJ/EryC1/StrS family aminotransferase [Streptomyces sp. WA1-19]MBL0804023.1 DegT/DnrJ/EryC1/StrS family aminotransferase [Streptomyces albidoflavus]UDF11831.1 DegT/DnrJ/EryC1/StrS family aminotransferase [Streptomyces sp. WA1-19]